MDSDINTVGDDEWEDRAASYLPESLGEKGIKVKLIKNPLPLPKPRQPKKLEFDYEFSEDELKYDIEVKPGDDFKI